MTTPMRCSDATQALGVYLMGALDPRERADLESHLAGCPACRDELAGLAGLPGLMSRLTTEEVLSGPPAADASASGALLERLLTAAARERRVARHRRWLAAAASVVVLLGGGAAGVAVYRDVTATHWHTVAAAQGPVRMKVDMVNVAAGTSLRLWLSGVPAEERCRLVAISDTGVRETAGSWEASYQGTAVIKGTTAIPVAHLSRLVIETYDGQELVSAAV